MEQEPRSSEERNAAQRYIEILFDLNPDDEMLARMWEIEPETMHRLMPEIGNESESQLDGEMARRQRYTHAALNSLRVVLGREAKLTPRQRMRQALLNLEQED